jgi:hypothetical protein
VDAIRHHRCLREPELMKADEAIAREVRAYEARRKDRRGVLDAAAAASGSVSPSHCPR